MERCSSAVDLIATCGPPPTLATRRTGEGRRRKERARGVCAVHTVSEGSWRRTRVRRKACSLILTVTRRRKVGRCERLSSPCHRTPHQLWMALRLKEEQLMCATQRRMRVPGVGDCTHAHTWMDQNIYKKMTDPRSQAGDTIHTVARLHLRTHLPRTHALPPPPPLVSPTQAHARVPNTGNTTDAAHGTAAAADTDIRKRTHTQRHTRSYEGGAGGRWSAQ